MSRLGLIKSTSKKTCKTCGEILVARPHKRCGFYFHCAKCKAMEVKEWRRLHPGYNSKMTKKWRKAHPEECRLGLRRQLLMYNYGMTLSEYDTLLREQEGVCAICGNKETQRNSSNGLVDELSVDHNHRTGKVRGLLCRKCNIGIAKFDDNVWLLKRAIKYLKETK